MPGNRKLQTWENGKAKRYSHDSSNWISIIVRPVHQLVVLYFVGQREVHLLARMAVFSKYISSLDPRQKRSLLTLLSVVLLLRSRLITGPRDAFLVLKRAAGIREPTPEELEQARQQLYRRNQDGSKNVLITYRDRISEASPAFH